MKKTVAEHKKFSKTISKGFTLIELLVVIFIIGVLASVVLANILGARQRAEDVQKKAELDQFKKALSLFYNDQQRFPDAHDTNPDLADDYISTNNAFVGSSGEVYLKQLPTDYEYEYYVDATNDSFRVLVVLDNSSDGDITTSQARCPKLDSMDNYSSTDYVVCED